MSEELSYLTGTRRLAKSIPTDTDTITYYGGTFLKIRGLTRINTTPGGVVHVRSTQVNNRSMADLVDKSFYTIQTLVTNKEYVVDLI